MRKQVFNGGSCDISINTKRVKLSSSWDYDLETWLCWMRDPNVNRYLVKGGPRYSMEDLKEFFNSTLNDNQALFFRITEKKTDQHIGNFNILKCNFPNAICSIGLLIGPAEYRGNGYGQESTLAALNFAFTVLNMKVIEFDVAVDNNAAVNMYLALGCIPRKTPRAIKSHACSELEVDIYSIKREYFLENYQRLLEKQLEYN